MTQRLAVWCSWSLWTLAVALLALGTLLTSASDPSQVGVFILGPVLLAFLTVGALGASQRPEKPIGWVFCTVGLTAALYVMATGYATYTLFAWPGSLPWGVWMAWIASLRSSTFGTPYAPIGHTVSGGQKLKYAPVFWPHPAPISTRR